jgi:hypothetical protein
MDLSKFRQNPGGFWRHVLGFTGNAVNRYSVTGVHLQYRRKGGIKKSPVRILG